MNPFIRLVFCVIIIFALGLQVYGAVFNSPVQSEDAHLASGVGHWLFERFDLYKVNPPLVRVVAATPVVQRFSKDNSWYRYNTSPHVRSEFVVGIDVVRNRDDYANLMIRSRLAVCVVFGIVGLYFIWKFSESTFCTLAGFIALGLWCSNPYVLGHGATIMPDVPSAALAVTAVYFFWKCLRRPDNGNVFLSGVVLGLAELTKFTLLVFYPLFAVLWLVYRVPVKRTETTQPLKSQSSELRLSFRRMLLQPGLLFGVSLLVVNIGYLFEGTGKPLRSFKFQTTLFTGCETLDDVPLGGGNRFDGSGNRFETALGYLPSPLPANFIQGIDTQRLDFERGLPSYLRGAWSDHGWYCYYLYALLIKTPVGTLLFFLLAIVCTFFLKGYNVSWRDETLILLPGIVLLAFVSSQPGFSVHSRYAIPAIPFFFIWTSKVGRAFTGIPQPAQAAPSK
ncbi:MAG: glycosyltransferase family 39 protein, partial [Fibrobacter sp.]|nr:glycosyltransferase family 39 protein [Fibrobacter sp.]